MSGWPLFRGQFLELNTDRVRLLAFIYPLQAMLPDRDNSFHEMNESFNILLEVGVSCLLESHSGKCQRLEGHSQELMLCHTGSTSSSSRAFEAWKSGHQDFSTWRGRLAVCSQSRVSMFYWLGSRWIFHKQLRRDLSGLNPFFSSDLLLVWSSLQPRKASCWMLNTHSLSFSVTQCEASCYALPLLSSRLGCNFCDKPLC